MSGEESERRGEEQGKGEPCGARVEGVACLLSRQGSRLKYIPVSCLAFSRPLQPSPRAFSERFGFSLLADRPSVAPLFLGRRGFLRLHALLALGFFPSSFPCFEVGLASVIGLLLLSLFFISVSVITISVT